jgi:hypothetical protein
LESLHKRSDDTQARMSCVGTCSCPLLTNQKHNHNENDDLGSLLQSFKVMVAQIMR